MKNIIIITLVTIILLSAVYFIKISGLKLYIVTTSSMEPQIKAGSLILIDKKNQYKIGDIVTYQTSNSTTPVTHRIVEVTKLSDKYYVFTKGDKNDEKDPYPILEREIIGKVIRIIPCPILILNKSSLQNIPLFSFYIISGLILGVIIQKIVSDI